MAETLTAPVFVVFLVLTWCTACCLAMTPETPEATGRDVTDQTLAMVRDSNIFQADHSFFLRMAAVETEFGGDPITYRSGYDGGIWQVDEDRFTNTQDPGTYPDLADKYTQIQSVFGIDWPSVTWSDLRKPLYSAIAAQLYFDSVLDLEIPVTIEAQGSLFKRNWRITIEVEWWIFRVKIVIGGDPHVTQMVPGSNIAICYDVYGKSGDTFNFLTDPSTNFKINVELKFKYVEEIAMFVGQSTIFVTRDHITINGDVFQWEPNLVLRGQGAEEFVIEIKHASATMEFSLTQVNMTKSANRLDFSVNHFGYLDPTSSGILGDVANHVSVAESRNGANVIVTDIDGQSATSALQTKGHYWKVVHNMKEFTRLLDQNKIDCIDCSTKKDKKPSKNKKNPQSKRE